MFRFRLNRFLEALEAAEKSSLNEGIFDPHILKAVFMGGSGGSGKGFISDTMFSGSGLRVVNTDDAYELLLTKAGLIRAGEGPTLSRSPMGLKKTGGKGDWRFDVQMDPEHASQKLRPKAKKVAAGRLSNYIAGRLGLIIDSTATEASKVIKSALELDALGYDTYMVFVNTSLETSIERNAQRRRSLPDAILKADWAKAQKALPQYRSMFGPHYIEIDNNKAFGGTNPETWKNELTPRLRKAAAKFYNSPVKNPIGRSWMEDQLASRGGDRGRALKPNSQDPQLAKNFFAN